ncbi:MAG: metallophosphoesterase family protein [Nitrospirae bacterium]|nr:metallophosphoesterase family protein [Nitrospirota bacterium]
MRYAVISDVHANLEALETVLQDIKKRKIKDTLFLGDTVGYGPNPNECIELLKDSCKIMLAGNHDWAVIGLTDIDYFNEYARAAVEWTWSVIKKQGVEFLKTLPIIKVLKRDNMLLVHSTPKEPEEWHYLLTLGDAESNFHSFEQKMCFLGHSHSPSMIERLPSGEMVTYKEDVMLGKVERYIINVGSVGQPRDGDPRACYAIADDEKVELIRIKYNFWETQKKMHDAGLPLPLIERLERGV